MARTFLTDPLVEFNSKSPLKVVSLVPSWTASLNDLGLGNVLTAITDYCPSVPDGAAEILRIGPPKNPRVDWIIQSNPDLIIANQEENDRISIEAMITADIPVWLTFPKTVQEMLGDLWKASSLFRSVSAPYQLEILEKSVDWAELALVDQSPVRYFCPIWQDCLDTGEGWWMTFNQDTYSSDVLRLVNGENIFASRERKYPLQAEFGRATRELPGERDTRYPRVSFAEIVNMQPEVILLPDEPFSYGKDDISKFCNLFAQTPAGQTGRIYCIEGRLIHWPGTVLSKAIDTLSSLFS
jgi:iron complex transport system substrate-binding protein